MRFNLMQSALKILVVVSLLLLGLYHLAFFIMPSVTIHNDSGQSIASAKVLLANSTLDFGAIPTGASNTIHYQLAQPDGSYRYHITLSNGTTLTASCGNISNNQINKRMLIKVKKGSHIICSESI